MEQSCSLWSIEVGEPLAGSASANTDLWIVIEHAGAWGPKGLDDSGLPAEVVAHVQSFLKQNKRARAQLIRRPAAASEGALVYLARSTPGAPSLACATLTSVEQVLAIDFTRWAEGELLPGFRISPDPLYLVCVHGRRDRCCALHGMPVYSALAALRPGAVFQTTHLGGHRFAATLLVLPEGICYGRVQESEAEALTAAHSARRFHALSRVRGRCAYEGTEQAAEVRLREDLGETSLDALTLLGADPNADGSVLVRFRHLPSGVEHGVRVVKQALAPSAQSCGATARASEGLVALTSR